MVNLSRHAPLRAGDDERYPSPAGQLSAVEAAKPQAGQ
jgi:hypothetical protein